MDGGEGQQKFLVRLDRRDGMANEPMRGEREETRTTQERMLQGDVKGHIANSQVPEDRTIKGTLLTSKCQKTMQLRAHC
jgi:hypothetical protein